MRIGEAARAAGCQTETIRYYEHAGLLPKAARTDGNYRRYGAEHIERLIFIRHARYLDMTLDEIRALLEIRDAPEKNCGEVNALIDEHIGHIAERIGVLDALKKQLQDLRRHCQQAQASKDCGILNQLAHTDMQALTATDHRKPPQPGAHRRAPLANTRARRRKR